MNKKPFRPNKKTTEQFIIDAIKIHGNKYDYSLTIYDGARSIVKIICKIHGLFTLEARSHTNSKQGCNLCGQQKVKEALKFSNEDVDLFLLENDIPLKRIDEYRNVNTNMDFECLYCKNIITTKFSYVKFEGKKCNICYDKRYSNEEIDNYLIENKCLLRRIDEYKNNYTKIDFECLKCDEIWNTTFSNIKSRKSEGKCPICFGKKYTNEDIDNYLIENNRNIKRIDNYQGTEIDINWKCLKCNNIWPTKPASILRKRYSGCPYCNFPGRVNENIVRDFIINNNLMIEYFSIKLPININKSIPDFYISSLNLIIEYNGEQHYKPVSFGNKTKEEALEKFKYQQIRDQQLRDYCKENNINLLEIDGRKYKNGDLIKFLENYFNIIK